MSTLFSNLKFVTAERPASTRTVNPTEQRRANLIGRVEEQIALATAMLDGKTPNFTRTVKGKDGNKETKAKTVRPWFFPQGSKYLLFIRYGTHTLAFAKGMNAIECSSLKAVVTTLNTVKQAVAAGELDATIAALPKREKKSHA